MKLNNLEIIDISEEIEGDSNIKEYIDQNLQNDPAFDQILKESKINPNVMPSFPTFSDMFKLTIENINIHYHYGTNPMNAKTWKSFFKSLFKVLLMLDPPYKKITATIYIRLSNKENPSIWMKDIEDLNKLTKLKNWNKLRKEINEYCWKYYENSQINYRKELREWYNNRKNERKDTEIC